MLVVHHGAGPITERCSVTLALSFWLVPGTAVPARGATLRVTMIIPKRTTNRVDETVVIEIIQICYLNSGRRASFAHLESEILDEVEALVLLFPTTCKVQRGLFDGNGSVYRFFA